MSNTKQDPKLQGVYTPSYFTDRVYDYVADCIRWQGQAPTLNEIARALGYKSTCAPRHHLQKLEAQGLIVRQHGRGNTRAIQLVSAPAA